MRLPHLGLPGFMRLDDPLYRNKRTTQCKIPNDPPGTPPVTGTGDEAIKREPPVTAGPAAPRTWSDEEKVLIAQESFEPDMSVVEVAERHGGAGPSTVPVAQADAQGQAVGSSEPSGLRVRQSVRRRGGGGHPGSGARGLGIHREPGVTVRLDGDVSTVRITAIASALRGIR